MKTCERILTKAEVSEPNRAVEEEEEQVHRQEELDRELTLLEWSKPWSCGRQPTVWGLSVVGAAPKLWRNTHSLIEDLRRVGELAMSFTPASPCSTSPLTSHCQDFTCLEDLGR